MTLGARGRGFLLAVALAASFVGVASPARADVSAQGCSAHAVVVVDTGQSSMTVPICFDGTISGLDALQLAGANPVTYGFAGQGAAVCQLNGVGNNADSSCLIGPGGAYWAYFRGSRGSGWSYSRGGASNTSVSDGSIEGWKYGTGAQPAFPDWCSVVGCAPPPTDPPPATQPPPVVTAPPATAAPPTAAPSGTASATSAGKSGTKADGKSGDKADDTSGKGGDTSAAAAAAGGATTTTGKKGSTTASRSNDKDDDSVQVAAGGSGGGGDGGSPVGVIVALAVVAVAVVTGLVLRSRRRGPTPG